MALLLLNSGDPRASALSCDLRSRPARRTGSRKRYGKKFIRPTARRCCPRVADRVTFGPATDGRHAQFCRARIRPVPSDFRRPRRDALRRIPGRLHLARCAGARRFRVRRSPHDFSNVALVSRKRFEARSISACGGWPLTNRRASLVEMKLPSTRSQNVEHLLAVVFSAAVLMVCPSPFFSLDRASDRIERAPSAADRSSQPVRARATSTTSFC